MGVLSNNYAKIVPGALISASYVSDIYDVLMGSEAETVILSGSLVVTGSISSTAGVTGSLLGTSSYSVSASRAVSAVTASYALSASYLNYINTSSQSDTATTASYALTASYVVNSISSSFAVSSSYGLNSVSSSFATTASYAANVSLFIASQSLYVATNGNDSTAVRGDMNKPYQTLTAAKNAANSGDIIYVMPGTYTYDNRTAAGNPWNNQQTSMNLWKNGITYYFMPGAKIVVYNQTVTGQDLYLIRPTGDVFGTCTILGHLEYEQNGTGPDTSIGRNLFFHGVSIGAEVGFTFYAEVKNLTSNHCELINMERSSISNADSSVVCKVTITSETENYAYLGGQSASGGFYRIAFGDHVMDIKLNSKYRNYAGYYPWYISGDMTRSRINLYGEEVYNSGNHLCMFRTLTGVININVNNIYYNTAYTTFGFYGAIISTQFSGNGFICNLTANLIDYAPNTQTIGLFYITVPNNTINFTGNIITNTSGSSAGRFIAATTQPNNTININGDISLIGVTNTTNVLFQPNGGSTINFNGKITGNFIGPVVKTYNGTMNINNSYIRTTIDTGSVLLLQNGSTSTGTCRINNSYIEMKNSTSTLITGSYIKTYINNSTIVNAGSGSAISNTTANGSLQIANSMILTSGSTSISYTDAAAPVILLNTLSNVSSSIVTQYGTPLDVISQITF